HTDATWDGRAPAALHSQVLGVDVLEDQRAYNGPSGGDFLSSSYALDTVHADAEQCVALPPLAYSGRYQLQPCAGCSNVDFALSFQTKMCSQPGVDIDSQIDSDLHLAARATPRLTTPPPLEVKLNPAVCGGSAVAEQHVSASLPIVYDGKQSMDAAFVDPCLRVGVKQTYDVRCLGVSATTGSSEHPELVFGCATSPASGGAAALALGEISQSPAVAADGAGHAVAIWADESNPSATPSTNRYLFFSRYDGAAWNAPAQVSNQPALIERPQIAFLGAGRFIAVWVQSSLAPAQALAGSLQDLLASSELYFAIWDGNTWSQPAQITSDTLWDASPALAGDSASGTATVAWVRRHADAQGSPQSIGLYAARFDGSQWSPPSRLSASSVALDYQPSVAVDRSGVPTVVWVRDIDGSALTSDRQLMLAQFTAGGWGTPQAVPLSPLGALSPSLAFDTANEPLVAFLTPATEVETGAVAGGSGNTSSLFVAQRHSGAWNATEVSSEIRAEGPVARITSDNQAHIFFRGFSFNGGAHDTGDLAAAVADLGAATVTWSAGYLSDDGQVNWEVAADLDPSTRFVASVKKPSGSAHRQVVLAAIPYNPDLTVSLAAVHFADSHPLVGDSVTMTVDVRNLGLRSTGDGGFSIKAYEGDSLLATAHVATSNIPYSGIPELADLENSTAGFPLSFALQSGGVHTITVVVDEANELGEVNKTNNQAQVTFGEVPPPRNLTVQVDGGRQVLSLQWDAPSTRGIARYEVYRTSGAVADLVGGTEATTFVDTLAVPGNAYHYVVEAVDIYGVHSAFSNQVTAQIEPQIVCTGDCNGDGEVTIDELLTGVNIALESVAIDRCLAFDVDSSGTVTVDELLAAVNRALDGCS
ncbi:MAG TPA: CARDB domain-containing protein, partial [Candidatus Acidoferrales bacterium]|nr:CARDB domain-containing protein [Candidatus Acidoferrales bacterium]